MTEQQKNSGAAVQEFRGSFLIRNRLGLHARAAAVLVQLTRRFQSEIFFSKEEQRVNGKSIMAVLQLAAVQGDKIEVTARGADGAQALTEIGRLIEQFFGEEE